MRRPPRLLTHLDLDPAPGLVTVFVVRHAGYPKKAAGKVHGSFRDAAIREFGGGR